MQLMSKLTTKLPYKKLKYPTYVKDTNPNVHIKVLKKAIKANGEIMEANIINMFGFILIDSIFEWGENYVQDHPNCTFEELEQEFCKGFRTVKNDEEVYVQLWNTQQQIVEHVEVYYERLLKLANCLQVKTIDVFLTIVFRVGLLPYLGLAIVGMKRNTLIEQKEIVVVCEENGPISSSYNVILTTLEANAIIKLVVPIVKIKSTLTYTNCGKTDHSVETCHNRKREVLVVSTTLVKSIELIARTKTQLVKLGKILVCYSYIICFSIEHRSGECPRKIEVQNMFRIKHISSNGTTTLKPFKTDNVPINVIVVVTNHSQ